MREVKTFAFLHVPPPSEYVLVARSRGGPGWEFLSAGSRVRPFERMFVACLLLRDGQRTLTTSSQNPFPHFQKLGSVPKASHILG